MDVTLQYFVGCPHWETTDRYLETLLAAGETIAIRYQLIDGHDAAMERGFRGSPTVLVDGVDPFSDPEARVGLACRVYRTDHGTVGSPTIDQLRAVIASAQDGR
ncbi:MAG: thioredoxin family protein [Actinobacteria bacterium]|nr:thioredoxin family protein [Actinomycetota bacterium]